MPFKVNFIDFRKCFKNIFLHLSVYSKNLYEGSGQKTRLFFFSFKCALVFGRAECCPQRLFCLAADCHEQYNWNRKVNMWASKCLIFPRLYFEWWPLWNRCQLRNHQNPNVAKGWTPEGDRTDCTKTTKTVPAHRRRTVSIFEIVP